MPDPYPHLHVASGHSLQYGASLPHVLVEQAAEHGMDLLALTDRDGTYGAVKFAGACRAAGLSPVLGVDLAYRRLAPSGLSGGSSRTPVRGGAFRDPRLPRVTLLAQAAGPGGGAGGWAAVCRLVSATHLAGERGRPVLDPEAPEIAGLLASGDLVVLLGPGSLLGEAITRRDESAARAELAWWRDRVPAECLQVELVSHRLPGGRRAETGQWGPATTPHAARTALLAAEVGVPTVLTNAVRHARREDAAVADVLDAARRLVALDRRHVDRGNAEGHLKPGPAMREIAQEIAHAAGLARGTRPGTGVSEAAMRLLARTRTLAERCALDPRTDLGIGEVHFPEFELARGPSRGSAADADQLLRVRCEAAIGDRYGSAGLAVVWKRLDDELTLIRDLGYASYFLTVGDVTDLIKALDVRVAARGSGAGSLVTYLLGISGVDPVRYQLLMERFLSPLRRALPDIDVDVESARRTEVYEAILDRFGGERCVCVSMMDTYRVRHAVRDVGAALGMPPVETDAIAKAFPHIRARDARAALRDLPELRASGLGEDRLALLFGLVERLDGLPRHIAVHPCGVLLSDLTLLDRTPVEASYAGFPMSQFDKDDVEELGLLKLDVLGIRMQSSMAHAVAEIRRVEEVEIDLDDQAQVPLDDPATYAMISAAQTLGVFQIESPGQRELVGKSGIDTFEEIIADISLFRPGPVKSDMITPYLEVKHQWKAPEYLHDDLRPILAGTRGVVVFHEQVIEIISRFARVTYAEADEMRRALGTPDGMAAVKAWFFPRALKHDYSLRVVERVWAVLEAFASFGFCKAHAAAFALPTYQSAWLKAHWPAHFLAGVLTHDPGMYPKRLILEDARHCGIAVLPLDVNASGPAYTVERLPERSHDALPSEWPSGRPDGRAWGIRLALAEVKGIAAAEVARVVAARPYHSLTDFWRRAQVSRPVVERLVLAGAFDGVYDLALPTGGLHEGARGGVRRRGAITRRDLLLQVAELDRHGRAVEKAARGRGLGGRGLAARRAPAPSSQVATAAVARNSTDAHVRERQREGEPDATRDARRDTRPADLGADYRDDTGAPSRDGIWGRSSAQARTAPPPAPVDSVQLALDLGDAPSEGEISGLPEMSAEERMRAELEILGLDASRHVVDTYEPFLDALGVVRSRDLLAQRSRSGLLVAGVKVATQTPPIRSGRRVVFLTLDDGTGPVDATFFEDAQGPYAATVFGSWLLVVRGELRRTGHRGVSLRATGAWELPALHQAWRVGGLEAVHTVLETPPPGFTEPEEPRGRRVLVHSSGFKLSPYADIKPAGESTAGVPRSLWHRSPGSPG
ncbi:DNA polymerase III subunit alpha [Nocardioides acrostichi]|uniref:DNA polymerase III subunit alpha n=1 Tax=Nocardioides acrostichi TaxID=2784339 RepID=A0A930UZU0_9ACTN|nr:DNA polymerase III subunit alpha [Nocardioides acrostichi]MBF4160609.1 DNA polymerase III subunit alpha [Nocardioides acrostichi]